MTVTELKNWLNNLPDEKDDYAVVIRDLKEIDDKVYNRDSSVSYGIVEEKTKQINLFDVPSTLIIQKIRDAAQPKEEKIKGSLDQTNG
jgi:hypothetical protein